MKSKIFHFKLMFAPTLWSFVLFERAEKNVCEKGMPYTFIVLEHTLKQPNCIPQRICTALLTWHSILTTTATTNKYSKLMPFQYRNEQEKKETKKSVPNKFPIDILSVCCVHTCVVYFSSYIAVYKDSFDTHLHISNILSFLMCFLHFISLMLLTSKHFLLTVA